MADKSHCALPEQTAFPFELPPAMSGPEFCSLPCGFPGGSDGKESACNAGDLDLTSGLGTFTGEGNSYTLQYSGLENSVDYIYSPWGRKELDMMERFSHIEFIR